MIRLAFPLLDARRADWPCGGAHGFTGRIVCSNCDAELDPNLHVHIYRSNGTILGAACSEGCAIQLKEQYESAE